MLPTVSEKIRWTLKLAATLFKEDNIASPLLPGFSCPVELLFG